MKSRHTFLKALSPLLFVIVYFILSLSFLTEFPFIHSDEGWLGGLSLHMMEQDSLRVTEPFFTLKPRIAHCIRTIYHLLLMLPIHFFGYSAFSVRLVSLIAACILLLIFYKTALLLFKSRYIAGFTALFLAVDIQFIYASHFGRQEMLICLFLVTALYLLLCNGMEFNRWKAILLSILTWICIGIHPNSFILAVMIGCVLFSLLLYQKAKLKSWISFGIYVILSGLFAGIYVFVSNVWHPGFLKDYLSYGAEEFGVLNAPSNKMIGLFSFIKRLLQQNSGTYYTPNIRIPLLLFFLFALFLLCYGLVMRKEEKEDVLKIRILLSALLGILLGITLIGRFNQTSILFLFPIGYLLVGFFLNFLEGISRKLIPAGISIILFTISLSQIRSELPANRQTYDYYLEQISSFVPSDAKTLGNLNTVFYFNDGCLIDYRNLPFLEDKSLSDYLDQEGIEYIIYSDELDYIYDHRPYFNVIYGNIMFLDDLKHYLDTNCEVMGSFQNTSYGVRIISLRGNSSYGNITIYKVIPRP